MKMHTCEHPPPTSKAFSKGGIAFFIFRHFICLTLTSLEVLLFNYMSAPKQHPVSSIQFQSLTWSGLQDKPRGWRCVLLKHIEIGLYSLWTVFRGHRVAGSQGGGGEERDQPSHIWRGCSSQSVTYCVCNINFVCPCVWAKGCPQNW